jgi:hypothetical protein
MREICEVCTLIFFSTGVIGIRDQVGIESQLPFTRRILISICPEQGARELLYIQTTDQCPLTFPLPCLPSPSTYNPSAQGSHQVKPHFKPSCLGLVLACLSWSCLDVAKPRTKTSLDEVRLTNFPTNLTAVSISHCPFTHL